MQDANLERYLEAAKNRRQPRRHRRRPAEFYTDPGKTGFEMSAINRIKEIYDTYGFRTVSGEGGRPFGLEKYGKAFYVAWRYQHRAALGEPNVTLKDLATREGIQPPVRRAHLVGDQPAVPGLPFVGNGRAVAQTAGARRTRSRAAVAAARTGCEELQKFVTTWPSWLFGAAMWRPAAPATKARSSSTTPPSRSKPTHHFNFNRGGRGGGGAARRSAAPGPRSSS